MYLELAGLYAYSYFIGAVPTPYLIARLVKGIDLRQYGSGNVGGSNVIRQLGKKWFLPLTALEFALKGLSPALVGLVLLDDVAGLHRASPWFLPAPLLALVGNNWSVFLRFQGGRGLLVICGMLVTLTPLLFLGAILVYLLGWRLSRNSAIWALVAVAILPVLALVPPRYLAAGWGDILTALSGGPFPPVMVSDALMLGCFCLAILAVVVLKRLLSNSLVFPQDLPRKRVLVNRFLQDRDVDDRSAWLSRAPEQ